MPVIAGSGTNGTTKSIALSQAAEAAGADALLVVTPYYNKPSRKASTVTSSPSPMQSASR